MTEIAVELKNVWKRFNDFVAVKDVSLKIFDGEFFSLLGPSGCGKTTNLRMIAGFDLPTEGEIYLKGKPVGQLPPFKRDVNTVFQSYALFPHLTIEQNVAFGLEMKRVSKPEIAKRVKEALEMVRLPNVSQRRPHQLSGGQKQRVALARAIVNRPQLLLLDEPLGALDLKLRKAMQIELKQLQRQLGLTFVYVTHDQEEALVMSDRVGVMSEGKLLQVDAPRELYDAPVNRFVADFIGETNFVACQVEKHLEKGQVQVSLGKQIGLFAATSADLVAGQAATLAIRPEKVQIYSPQEIGPGDVHLPARVLDSTFIGTDTRYRLELAKGIEIESRFQNDRPSINDVHYAIGENVIASWFSSSARILAE